MNKSDMQFTIEEEIMKSDVIIISNDDHLQKSLNEPTVPDILKCV